MAFSDFIGTGVAIVTPFKIDKSIDFEALEKLVKFQIKENIDYIVVLGTTGESVTLDKSEKREIINCVLKANNDQVPVMVGIGGYDSNELLKTIKSFDFQGVSAILSVSPYYNKPSQEGIYQHYKLLADNSPIPIILYNVPGRTGSNINAETTIRLAKNFRNIIGIKEASGNFDQISTIIKNRPKDFLLISGDDSLTFPMITLGANGAISVIANALPNKYSQMVRLAIQGKFYEAATLHFEMFDLMKALFLEGSPAGIKAALNSLNFISDELRLPLVPVGKNTYDVISKLLSEIK